ncbi:MAG: ATPase [Alphaproteobacteria bacterium]|nr:MAG: ATPase [Alphaproteobacteria bacterium]
MFNDFYGFEGKPFQLTPDPSFYFDSSTHHKAMAYLTYGLSQGEGFIIVTGEIGAGKTTLVARLLDELDTNQYVAAKIVTTHLDADDILRMVAAGFGLNIMSKDKAILLNEIEVFLRRNHQKGKRALLIIDEVQNLPIPALEELRMLSNFQEGDTALLQSFLIGQPEFRDKWAFAPELEQLRQRVIATHHLQSMTNDETKEYIQHRLKIVGWKGKPFFTDDAFEIIYQFTNGVPRKLNTLCSRILLFGSIEELDTIDNAVVSNVIEDMERDIASSGLSVKRNGGQYSENNAQSGLRREIIDNHVDSPEIDRLKERIYVLEKYVKIHDETIKSALEILASLMAQNEDQDI